MKPKIAFISTLISFSTLVTFCVRGQQEARWQGKIEKSGEVKIINNPNKPLYGKVEFELEEDISIGNEEDGDYSFNRVRGLAVDDEGNIYASDADEQRIQKFDRYGKFLQTIGKATLVLPMKVLLNEKRGLLYVLDGGDIKIFNKEGMYLSHIPVRPSDFLLSQDGDIFVVAYSEPSVFLRKVNSQGQVLMELAKFPFEQIIGRFFEGMLPGDDRAGVEYDLFVTQIDTHTIIYGYSKEYELNVEDDQGKPILKIRKEEPYREFSEYRKQSVIGDRLPPHLPFFHSLFTDGEDLIFVQKNFPSTFEDRKCDVFSRDGLYFYETSIPKDIELIHNGCLYTFEPGKIENKYARQIKRYRIKNWQSIKKGIQQN
ncbi:MAG: hypothetical protein WBC70_13475 [Candidatus Aminicenantales bacterium]